MVTSNYRARARGLPKSWYLSSDIDSASVTALCGENGLRYSGSDMFRFRAASRAWQDCFDAYSAQNPPGVTVMRRGIDECFLELTALAMARIQRGEIKVLATMDPTTKAKLQAQAQERMRVAEAKWRAEESKLDPSIPRESLGGVRAAIRASASSDPMTAKSIANRGSRFPSGQVSSPAKAEPATAITSASPLPLVVIGSESLLTLPPHLVGKSEAEIEEYCNKLHPIDFCRGDKHTQDAPMNLYTRAALDQLAQQGQQLQVDPHSPWVGQVLLSGWNPSESQAAFRSRPRDTYAHTPGSHNLDAAATFGETIAGHEEEGDDSDIWGEAQGLEDEGELEFEGDRAAASSSSSSTAAASSSSAAAATPASSSSSAPLLFAPVSGMDWTEADLVVPPLFDSFSSSAAAGSSASSSGASHDLILAVGAQIAFEIRSLLFARMGLTTSACVAPNCMLAKMGSQMHKPNQQSVIRPSVALAFLRPLALKRVPQFGPKAQARVHPLGLTHIAQIQSLLASTGTPTVPPPILLCNFPPKLAQTLTNIANGVDDTIVKRLGAPKSLAQEKGQLIRTDEDMVAQLGWLADQLARRLQIHELEWNMRATSLSIGWRHLNPSVPRGSASAPLPSVLFATPSRPGAEIEAVAVKLWRKSLGSPFPAIKYLGLGVHTWKPIAKEKEKLGNYFHKQPAAAGTAAAGTGSAQAAITANASESKHPTHGREGNEEEEDLLSLLEARDSAPAPPAAAAAASSSSAAAAAPSLESDPIDSLMGVAATAAPVSNDSSDSFTLAPTSAAAAAAALFPCTQCPTVLSSSQQLQEHLDFHFAQQYQQRVRAEDREQREAQQAAQLALAQQQASKKSKPNKRTAAAAAATSPAASITRFFQPPPQPK